VGSSAKVDFYYIRSLHMGSCPKCNLLVSSVIIESVNGSSNSNQWNCISYSCPSCKTVLNVQIDPIALKADVIEGVIKKLRG
jgi:hypothetical protein